MTAQYIGPWEILSQDDLSDETVRVVFKEYLNSEGKRFQPPVRDYTKKTLAKIMTETPVDYNDLQKRQLLPIADEILQILLTYDVNIGTKSGASDLDTIFREVYRHINDTRQQLEDKYWGAEEDEKTLRQLFGRWMEQKDVEIRKLTILPPKPSKKK
jgi:hypothetical protein